MSNIDIAVAYGDGIGPEIMKATLSILKSAGAKLTLHEVSVGEKAYLAGHKTGIEPESWDILRKCKVFLKAPITTPQGGGYRSLNVTIRAAFGLYANIRPCVAYAPAVDTKYPGMDLVIVRENEEDLYTGLEYRPTNESFHALKMITRPGCEKICRYAFEYAKTNNRKKVTCFTKDNILKLTDGLFHKVFEEIAKEYPAIEHEHWIIDIGAAKMTDTPENFDVIVMPNLYGDILSDIAAQIAGSVGLAGSSNIGETFAMFEAIHGSAPRRAGQDLANPSGLLMGAIMMLVHIGQAECATIIHNAWLKTIEDGIHTYDIYDEKKSKKKVGTKEFAECVILRLGEKPKELKAVEYHPMHAKAHKLNKKKQQKKLVGIDLFVDTRQDPEQLAKKLGEVKEIASRGSIIWPNRHPETHLSDLLRIRFEGEVDILALLKKCRDLGIEVTGHEILATYDGEAGFSK